MRDRRDTLSPLAVVVAAALPLVCGQPASAQGTDSRAEAEYPVDVETAPRPVGRAFEATTPIEVDGRLDEAAWDAAEPMNNFIQSVPDAGWPATEQTVVRVLYDDEKLYIGALCHHSRPEDLVVKTLEWEIPGLSSHEIDVFNVYLDPFLDRRNSYTWIINPGGAYRDGQTFDDSRNLDYGWDGIAEVRTRVHEEGWTVEMAIPWTTLSFDPTREEQVWGLNFFRRAKFKLEDSFWAPMDRRERGHKMSRAGTLVGLPDVEPGSNLSLRPYALAGRATGPAVPEGDRGGDFDVGGDLKFGITPRLTLDLTYNTDFSHVEVDQQRVNLTRFPLFFPEQRDFFVENSGTFRFGDLTERNYRTGSSLRQFTLFHSRRIGLSDGRPVPILGGGRLTGEVGGFDVGALNVQTEDYRSLPAENFSVLRVRRNVFAASDVGAMFTNVQTTGADGAGSHNRAYGVDANITLFDNLIINSYLAHTDATGIDGDATAGRVNVGWRDRLWDVGGFFRRIGEAFDPGIGFVRRRGIRHFYGTVGAHPRPDVSWLLDVNPYVEGHHVTTLEGDLETRTATAGFGVSFQDGGTLELEASDRFERVFVPFSVSSEVTVEAGEYDFREASAVYTTNRGRSVSGSVEISGGGYFGGTRRTVSAEVIWEPSGHFNLDASITRNDLDVGGVSTSADVFGGRVRASYSTRLSGSGWVQYNAATDELVTSARLTFIYSPLSNFYLVFTDRRGGDPFDLRDRFLSAKLTRYIQF